VIVLNLSWPAVSHTWSLTLLSSTLIFLILKSIPIWKFSNKVGTNGGHVADGEAVLRETEEEAGLADT